MHIRLYYRYTHLRVYVSLLESSSTEDSIGLFAQHYKLKNTLRYLSGGNSVGDLPVQLSKVCMHAVVIIQHVMLKAAPLIVVTLE